MTSYETAHEIFTHHTPSEIQTISSSLTQLIQDHHQKLQNLVNKKYRDLLLTSDLIIEMEQISQRQDSNLYELSFLKDKKLEKLIKIEDNFKRFYKQFDLLKKNQILLNSNNFLKFSKFLNIGNDNNNILLIISQLKEFNFPIIKESWFYEYKTLILKKFKYLFDLIYNNLIKLNINELKQVYEFLENLIIIDNEHCDMIKFNKKFLEIFIKFIKNQNDLLKILNQFNFKYQLKFYYSNKLNNLFKNLEILNLNEKNEELKLYKLKINDDNYLYNIKMLNQGLIYSSQRHFNELLISSIKTLNILKKLDQDETKNLKRYIIKLKGNKKLEKYKEKLIKEIEILED